jgi:hypothetical protein
MQATYPPSRENDARLSLLESKMDHTESRRLTMTHSMQQGLLDHNVDPAFVNPKPAHTLLRHPSGLGGPKRYSGTLADGTFAFTSATLQEGNNEVVLHASRNRFGKSFNGRARARPILRLLVLRTCYPGLR